MVYLSSEMTRYVKIAEKKIFWERKGEGKARRAKGGLVIN